MSVKGGLTAERERQVPEFAGFVRRAIRAHGRRVGAADPEELAELVAMRATLEEAIATAVDGLRAAPREASWAEIARALGVTRQAAQQRYGGRPSGKLVAPMPGQLDLWA